MAVTIRVRKETHQALKELSKARGVPITQLLDEATEQMRRTELLRQDPKAWAEELEERRLWECTLMDGLEDDPWEE
jgi:predicted transcriptional regulator